MHQSAGDCKLYRKLIRYERNPGNGDYSYLQKAFYHQCDELQGIHEADSVSSNFSPIFPQYTIFEEKPSYNTENPTFPSGSEVITEMNERYGFSVGMDTVIPAVSVQSLIKTMNILIGGFLQYKG